MTLPRQILTSTLLILSNICIAQQNDSLAKSEKWTEVIVMQMDTTHGGCGEGEINTRKNVKHINDISESELREIKQIVANDNGRIVYIDIRHTYCEKRKIYFTWKPCSYQEKIK